MISIPILKNRIKSHKSLSKEDIRVLSIVDSYWGCDRNYIKANLASDITEYAGCEAWKITMEYIYTEN